MVREAANASGSDRRHGRARGRPGRLLGVASVLALVVAGCGGEEPAERRVETPAEAAGGWIGADGELVWTGEGDGSGVASTTAAAGASPGREADEDRVREVEESMTAGDAVVAPEPGPEPGPGPVDTELSAGSVDDNESWEDYLLYREEFARAGIEVHDVDVSGRQAVTVVTPDGAPVLGADVRVLDGAGEVMAQRTTYADGRILFYAAPTTGQDQRPAFRVEVSKGDATAEATLDSESLEHTVTLDAPPAADPVALDVLFLIDATGSMGDEIEQLKANMISVAEQIDALSPRPDVHFAMTVYRDRGDLFVTRTFDFTSDVAQFTDALREVVAADGGDGPESLNQALHDALAEPSWRDGEAVRLVFLLADAPPHLDYDDDADYATDMQVAAERGVKVHPIASSGLDDQGEYVLRQIAQYTTGRFNFLTYGADGTSPGDSTPHHVDDYSVLSLDELVVRLVADELAALRGE